jgi:hypothetical protein
MSWSHPERKVNRPSHNGSLILIKSGATTIASATLTVSATSSTTGTYSAFFVEHSSADRARLVTRQPGEIAQFDQLGLAPFVFR